MTRHTFTRRKFIAAAAASPFAFHFIPRKVWGANERFLVAGIGVGGKGAGEVDDVTAAGGTFVALCDVDHRQARKTFEKYPSARRYTDFREMLAKETDLDAVTVSTPDHTHAVASLMAMSMGKHVYCQKPLTHSVFEARMMTVGAERYQVQTQMGNQAHAGETIRRVVELIRAGTVGAVSEVHAWTNRPIWPQGQKALNDRAQMAGKAPPAELDWDLWLGPAPQRPFNDCYVPFKWRGWWDFGTGALGDMACHILDLPFWALGLGSPLTISAEHEGATAETGPDWSTITFQFPARPEVGGGALGASVGPVAQVPQPPVKVVWYDGVKNGRQNAAYDLLERASAALPDDQRRDANGQSVASPENWDMVIVGDQGIMAIQRGSARWVTNPAERLLEFQDIPKTIPRVANEDEEWVAACRGGSKALSSFDYAGPLTETILLGNLAIRLNKTIEWDAANLKVKNTPEADALIRPEYRAGWELPALDIA